MVSAMHIVLTYRSSLLIKSTPLRPNHTLYKPKDNEMHIVIPPYEPASGTGFGDDIFNRKSFASSLTNLIRRTDDPLVISLNGSWGEGKTTFVKAWQAELNDQKVPNLYIDAFASDYVDDAFMVVAGAITEYMKQNAPSENTREFVDVAKRVGAHFLSLGAKIAIKAGSAGLLSIEDFQFAEDALKDVGDELGKGAEDYIKSRLENHSEELDSIKVFKSYLSSIPDQLSHKSDHSFTVIIDELDRCRPSFAIEMLEKIKHLFSVKNITFVLVINKQQLQESIRFTYGSNIDAHAYLQKFLTFETEIPRKGSRDKSVVKAYCEYLAGAHEIERTEEAIALFSAIGEQFKLTLRQLEKVISNYTLLSASKGEPKGDVIGLYAGLCGIRVSHPEIFKRLDNLDISYDEFYHSLKYQNNEEILYTHELNFCIKWIGMLLMNDESFTAIDKSSMEHRIYSTLRGRNRQSFLTNAINDITMFTLN